MDWALVAVVGGMGMPANTVLMKNAINRHTDNPYALGR
jgi:hypothetical protein